MSKRHRKRPISKKEYLKSPQWKKKSEVIRRRRPLCDFCQSAPTVYVYHFSDESLGFETRWNVAAACEKCRNQLWYIQDYTLIKPTNLKYAQIMMARHNSYLGKTITLNEELVDLLQALPFNAKKTISGFVKVNFESLPRERLIGATMAKLDFAKMYHRVKCRTHDNILLKNIRLAANM